jgi:hypothetical protein
MATDYWYNLDTNSVEAGDGSNKANLMGPYGSEAEAANALKKARENTERWDAEEEEDD